MSMSSPLPPDPYIALGVSKDADIGQIRTAHRKLVLKFHPDRIKGDDIEEKDKAKNEFQKVQQAYELLVDSTKRSKYDDQVRLAELVRERLMHQRSRPSAQSTQSSGPGVVRREVRRDGNLYEERAPPTSYFDERDHDRDHDRDYSRDQFDEPLPKGAARKHEAPYEKERKPSVAKSTERREKVRSRAQSPNEGISSRISSKLQAKAQQARDRARDVHAKTQETRDRERRRERSDKPSRRPHAYVEVESESDSDTEVPRHYPRPSKPARAEHEPRVRQRPSPVRRALYDDEDSYDDGEKWEEHHLRGMEYIRESQKRPTVQRGDSDAYVYWGGDYTGRNSDTERRPAGSRRTRTDEARSRPSMPAHNSAPNNLRSHVYEERAPAPSRSKTGPAPSDRDRETRPPNLPRSQTMPTNRGVRKDSLPVRQSPLKHSETQDSGYYSTSSPVTPEMKGESPPPSRENSSRKKNTAPTRYQIVEPEGDSDGGASRVKPFFNSDDEHRPRRTRSPIPDTRDRDRDRDRDRYENRDRDRGSERARGDRSDRDRPRDHERPTRSDPDSRPRPTRQTVPNSSSRGDFDRRAPNSPRGSPPPGYHRKLFGEVRTQSYDDKDVRSWSHVKTNDQYEEKINISSGWARPMQADHASPRFRDEPGRDYFQTKFDEGIRHDNRRRQPAVH